MARRVISVRDPHAAETLSPPSRTTQQLQKPMLAAARPSSFSLLHHAPRWPLYCSCYGQACMGDIMLVCVFFPPLGCRYLKPIIIIQTRQSNYLIKQSICRPCCCILSLQMRLCREKAFQRCLPGANSFFWRRSFIQLICQRPIKKKKKSFCSSFLIVCESFCHWQALMCLLLFWGFPRPSTPVWYWSTA